MVVHCEIEFEENTNGTYFVGQVVSGKITLSLDKSQQVQGIAVKINGSAVTKWSQVSKSAQSKRCDQINWSRNSGTASDCRSNPIPHSKPLVSQTTWYKGEEDYIATTTYLLGSDENPPLTIDPGIHTYNFACPIPTNCPSSFEGTFGYIRYAVQVVLIQPWKFDEIFLKAFTVLKLADLNYDSPNLRGPASQEISKTSFCGPCQSAPLKIKVTLPQIGFVCGQNIPVDLFVRNDSNIPVQEMIIQLAMFVRFLCQTPHVDTLVERISVAKVSSGPVMKHCTQSAVHQIRVPAIPSTCFTGCNLIQIAYQIEVKAKMKSFHSVPVICMPITIGNVPLASVIQQQPTGQANALQMLEVSRMTAIDRLSVVNSMQSPLTADSNILPPFSFEQSVHAKRVAAANEDQSALGLDDFVPKYPVYSMSAITAPIDCDDLSTQNGNTNAQKSTWL